MLFCLGCCLDAASWQGQEGSEGMYAHGRENLLGFGSLGGVLPDKAGGLRVQQLVPEAATDQVGPLRQVEHASLCRHCDAACLQPHTATPVSLPNWSHQLHAHSLQTLHLGLQTSHLAGAGAHADAGHSQEVK